MKARPSAEKRRKELARMERQQEKAERRKRRKLERAMGLTSGDDPDADLLGGDPSREFADVDGEAPAAEQVSPDVGDHRDSDDVTDAVDSTAVAPQPSSTKES